MRLGGQRPFIALRTSIPLDYQQSARSVKRLTVKAESPSVKDISSGGGWSYTEAMRDFITKQEKN